MTEFRRLPKACGCRRAVFVSLLSLDGGTYELVGHTVRVFPDDCDDFLVRILMCRQTPLVMEY